MSQLSVLNFNKKISIMKSLLIISTFLMLSTSLFSQDLSKLEDCTSYTCINNWLVTWEAAAKKEFKVAASLQNEQNRQNTCINILTKYSGNKLHYYGNNDPRRGPVRSHIQLILTRKDAEESFVDDFIDQYDKAYERISIVYQESLKGVNKVVPNATPSTSKNNNQTASNSKVNNPEPDYSKMTIEQKVKYNKIYVSQESIANVKKIFSKERFKELQKCLGVPENHQTGEWNAVTKFLIGEKIIDLSNGWTKGVIERIEGYCGETAK